MGPDRTVAYQPAQLYELVWNLIIFGIVWKLRDRVRGEGLLFLICATRYSCGRFFIPFVCEDNIYFANLHQAQIIALAVIAVAVPLGVGLNQRTKRIVRAEDYACS